MMNRKKLYQIGRAITVQTYLHQHIGNIKNTFGLQQISQEESVYRKTNRAKKYVAVPCFALHVVMCPKLGNVLNQIMHLNKDFASPRQDYFSNFRGEKSQIIILVYRETFYHHCQLYFTTQPSLLRNAEQRNCFCCSFFFKQQW